MFRRGFGSGESPRTRRKKWARLSSEKGIALYYLSETDADYAQSVACFDAALKVATRENFPKDWTLTQRNKGRALGWIKGQERAGIECFDAALSALDREQSVLSWGDHAISKRLRVAGFDRWRARRAILRAAIECFDAAIEVWMDGAHAEKSGRRPVRERRRHSSAF